MSVLTLIYRDNFLNREKQRAWVILIREMYSFNSTSRTAYFTDLKRRLIVYSTWLSPSVMSVIHWCTFPAAGFGPLGRSSVSPFFHRRKDFQGVKICSSSLSLSPHQGTLCVQIIPVTDNSPDDMFLKGFGHLFLNTNSSVLEIQFTFLVRNISLFHLKSTAAPYLMYHMSFSCG